MLCFSYAKAGSLLEYLWNIVGPSCIGLLDHLVVGPFVGTSSIKFAALLVSLSCCEVT